MSSPSPAGKLPWPSRRKAIGLLCGTGAALGLGVGTWHLRASSLHSSLLPDFQMEMDALRYIAEAYLRIHPAERDRHVLKELLSGSLVADAEPGDPRRAVRDAVGRDFDRGDTVFLDGWLLSRTEVRLWTLCAIDTPA